MRNGNQFCSVDRGNILVEWIYTEFGNEIGPCSTEQDTSINTLHHFGLQMSCQHCEKPSPVTILLDVKYGYFQTYNIHYGKIHTHTHTYIYIGIVKNVSFFRCSAAAKYFAAKIFLSQSNFAAALLNFAAMLLSTEGDPNSCGPKAVGPFWDPKGRSYLHLKYWTHPWRIDINISRWISPIEPSWEKKWQRCSKIWIVHTFASRAALQQKMRCSAASWYFCLPLSLYINIYIYIYTAYGYVILYKMLIFSIF